MGCRFCMTARQGFQHSLPAGEILNQVRNIPESNSLTNIVYMGMGEPLDNLPQVLDSLEVMTSEWGYGWSPTRITLSSIGVLPALPEFLERSRVHLAISLHNPFDDERRQMMPMQKAWPLAEVIGLLRKYDFSHQRRLSFEYILFEGINDTPGHAAGLASLLRGVDCRINLIRFHTIPGTEFRSCSEEKIQWFRDYLNARGLLTTIRASRGEDINAACGLLSTKEGAK